MEILRFTVNAGRYAVPLADVREVTRAAAIAYLPEVPPVIEGILDLRGELVPVLDVRIRFGLPAEALNQNHYFIIARAGTRTIALRVDAAPDIATIGAPDVTDPRAITVGTRSIGGVARLPDGLVLIHALETFLTAAESEWLEEKLADESGLRGVGG